MEAMEWNGMEWKEYGRRKALMENEGMVISGNEQHGEEWTDIHSWKNGKLIVNSLIRKTESWNIIGI